MQCPKCKSESVQVIDSRDVDASSIRRRRSCEKCASRFTTYERIEPANFTVKKRNGRIEPFDKDKILSGMEVAVHGRIGLELLTEIADDIENRLILSGEHPIATKKIGNMVVARLKKIDEISYLRFVSVYKNFEEIESFEQELTKLKSD
jgi:transcriptional repressor NrdR